MVTIVILYCTDFEPRIFKGKSLQLLLLKFRRKSCQCVGEMCIFCRLFGQKKSKRNLNALLTHTRNTEKTEFWKQKVYKLFSLNFLGFYVTLKISPFTTKSSCFILKKVDYKYSKDDFSQWSSPNSPLFSLIVALLCGVHSWITQPFCPMCNLC